MRNNMEATQPTEKRSHNFSLSLIFMEHFYNFISI